MISQDILKQSISDSINNKTKPPGSLGVLEDMAMQIGMLQGTSRPELRKPHIVVFAGDHGIAATGLVNPYPQEVTAQMVLNFLNGGAAINVFCRQNKIELNVVDAGVKNEFITGTETGEARLIHAKIGEGTRNYLEEPAMSEDELNRSIESGKLIVSRIQKDGCNIIGFGEMGIGNTSSAALIMSAITGTPVRDCVGRGTGVDDDQLKTKISTLEKVFEKHWGEINEGPANSNLSVFSHNILRCFGGFEIAMMVGAFLKAAELRMVVVVDGFIATAALLCAKLIEPDLLRACIFAHTSGEQGHQKMLEFLGAKPLLQFRMRLGEGTGAALAIPLIQSSVNFLNEMASFDSAGVSNKDSLELSQS
ncbi:MAG: nicotinate-nucleotide--dimethylbenzimidazole phosphoribosyltransferase [Bacteroidetes bacterium]|nr:MAG: nicotinate-nucleotide--dimethylbenzimidazole phosphoribosyltransferase [Bacteroidota bacterium]